MGSEYAAAARHSASCGCAASQFTNLELYMFLCRCQAAFASFVLGMCPHAHGLASVLVGMKLCCYKYTNV